jgi:hypothetical protein
MSNDHLRFGIRPRRAAIAIMTGFMIIPITGLVGLAVDLCLWSQACAEMSLAANGAALNAVKIAANAKIAGNSNFLADGATAGIKWFAAGVGANSYAATLSTITPIVTITQPNVTTLAAKVVLTSSVTSVFGKVFNVLQYPLTVEADAAITVAPYFEIIFMLDFSGSMTIGATNADMSTLYSLSPCDASNAFYGSSTNVTTWSNASLQGLSSYACSGSGYTYDGSTPCPVDAPATLPFTTFRTLGVQSTSESCTNLPKQTNGMYPVAGMPCALACHWTNSTNADGTTQDLFGLARRNGVTLRIDLLKNATNLVLSRMVDEDSVLNSLSVGIYTFNTSVTQVYPTGCTRQALGCEAGNDFVKAQQLVGQPPTLPNVTDTGIQPHLTLRTGNNDDTAFPEAMTSLATSYVTQAGNGGTPATARKALFLITDGFVDDPNTGARQAINPSYCTLFKNMGYSVYVVYTPYYPVMHTWYYANAVSIVEGGGGNSIVANLQSCSSGSSYYASAADQTTLNTAVTGFFSDALNGAAGFSR